MTTPPDIGWIVAAIPVPTVVRDTSTDRILAANEAVARLYASRKDEMVGQEFSRFAVEGATQRGGLHRHLSLSGEDLHVHITRHPLSHPNEDAELICVVDMTGVHAAWVELENTLSALEIAGRLGSLGAWVVDVPSMAHQWTDETRRIHGVPEGEHPDVSELIDFYEEEDRPVIAAAVQRCVEHGTPFDYRARLRRHDGALRWVRANGMALRNEKGEVYRIQGGLQDITDETQAKLDLVASEERYRSLFENHHTVMLLIDPASGTIVDANPAAADFYGWSRETLVGMHLSGINTMPPADIAQEMERARGLSRNHFEFTHRLADGSIRDVHVLTGPISQAGRQLLFSIVRDVTDQRKAESVLKLQGTALNSTANSIVITTEDGRIEWANTAFYRSSGFSEDEVLGHTPGELISSGQHDEAFYERMWETLRSGHVWTGEVVNRMRDGRLITEELTITPMVDDHGIISHYVGVKQDITYRKALERQAMRSQRVESIGTLAGGIAHDLNNILAPILLAIETLKTDLDTASRLHMLDRMEASARRGAELVKQVLAFSRGSDSKKVVLRPDHIARELEIIIQDTFPKNIRYTSEFASDLRLLRADPTQVHQVLMNLCVNARDAMPDGGLLSMRLFNADVDDAAIGDANERVGGPYVVFEIRDTGEGIPLEDQIRVFDPFFSTKEPGKGTGLGLPTVQTIVSNHGGFLTLDSSPGQGTTFMAYFPAAADAELEPVSSELLNMPTMAPPPDRHILVADDEEAIRTITSMTLERSGYTVSTASDGAEAVAVFRDHPDTFDLVILDGAMPVMDGMEALKQIRDIRPDVPVVLSSGFVSPDSQASFRSAGIVAFLDKPYTTVELLDVVVTAMS